MNNTTQTVVLCDLDGCFIDDRWRRHLCDWKNRKFEQYHAGIKDDPKALPVMLEVLKRHKAAGDKIYFTTARPAYTLDETVNQINKFTGWNGSEDYSLFMRRQDQEGIPSADLKRGMFEQIRECYVTGTEFYAYDDHGDVCQMYYDMGIRNTFLVNDMIAVECDVNMASQICSKIRSGFSFRAQMYRYNDYNRFLYFTDNIISKSPLDQVFREGHNKNQYTQYPSVELDTYEYEGDKERADRMAANITAAHDILMDRTFDKQGVVDSTRKLLQENEARNLDEIKYDVEQKPMNLNHVSISVGYINRDEKERNEELLSEVKEEWLSPDVANLPRILEMSAQTFSDRREVYGDSSDQYGRIMEILMENNKFSPAMAKEYEMMMFFSHVVGKLVRFSNSGFQHVDSIHDIINYAGLVECCVIGINKDIEKVEDESE